jgi:hypothetical protein
MVGIPALSWSASRLRDEKRNTSCQTEQAEVTEITTGVYGGSFLFRNFALFPACPVAYPEGRR